MERSISATVMEIGPTLRTWMAATWADDVKPPASCARMVVRKQPLLTTIVSNSLVKNLDRILNPRRGRRVDRAACCTACTQPLDQMVAHAQRVGHDRQSRVHCGAGR